MVRMRHMGFLHIYMEYVRGWPHTGSAVCGNGNGKCVFYASKCPKRATLWGGMGRGGVKWGTVRE